ncbi:MAG: ParB/RepB/Spo0J family partition protein [Candidatus Neomarinimicrobiota bacterium]|nr:ParB/RepB/Spo0J family partition protein [Candidatus Neomarinimicrobiota bacterium]
MSADRLGRGLEALIRPKTERKKSQIVRSASPEKSGVTKIPIKSIKPNPKQPRRDFDENALAELAASIKEKGVVTPITVREADNGYELVAGERRWRAAKKLRLRAIPAYVVVIKNDAEMMEMALIENIQREDLNPLEESEAYAVLNSKFGLSQSAIAKSVGKKRVTVTNALRLLKLPPEIRKSIRVGEISGGHGRAILQAKTVPGMIRLWKKIVTKELSVRAAETLVKSGLKSAKKKKVIQIKSTPQIRALENQLIEKLGTKVKLRPGKKGGSIEISYFSNEDLDRILDLFESLP